MSGVLGLTDYEHRLVGRALNGEVLSVDEGIELRKIVKLAVAHAEEVIRMAAMVAELSEDEAAREQIRDRAEVYREAVIALEEAAAGANVMGVSQNAVVEPPQEGAGDGTVD